jgi:nitrate reductase / nitrite oxidoreductase, beta subunit
VAGSLKAGGRVRKLLGIFASPVQPKLADYYEPWTYDYQTLIEAPLGDDFPVARPKSLITGEDTKITWSANWDDNLGGVSEQGHLDPIVQRYAGSLRTRSSLSSSRPSCSTCRGSASTA